MQDLRTQFISLPDLEVAHCEHGSGPTVLLLHGNFESKRIFARHQQEHLADFHTIALDSRGHGESRSEDLEYSIPQFCQDVIRFCEKKGIKRAHLVGYSDGGNIALLLAKHAPHLFDKVIAISPNYLVEGTEEGWLRSMHLMHRIFVLLKRIGFRTHKWIMRFELMLKDIGITAEELKSIRTGMKILHAEKEMIKIDHIREIASLIPGSDLEMIPDCNHMNILEQPRTITAIREYLVG